jgi:hypothetical protein
MTARLLLSFVDGYVLTAGFSTTQVIFSFHRFAENRV